MLSTCQHFHFIMHVTIFGLLMVPEWRFMNVLRLKTLNVSSSEVVPEKRQKLNRLATTVRSQQTGGLWSWPMNIFHLKFCFKKEYLHKCITIIMIMIMMLTSGEGQGLHCSYTRRSGKWNTKHVTMHTYQSQLDIAMLNECNWSQGSTSTITAVNAFSVMRVAAMQGSWFPSR